MIGSGAVQTAATIYGATELIMRAPGVFGYEWNVNPDRLSANGWLRRTAAETTSGIPNTFDLGSLQADGFSAPGMFSNEQGFLSNGNYNLDAFGQAPHQTGSLAAGKSQFFYNLNSDQLVLDSACYADQQGAWTLSNGSKAKISFDQQIGVDATTGLPTSNLNLYRTSTGFVHGSPGSP